MYVATIPNRGSRPAILLRESYREGGKVKTRTLTNISDWPAERVELLRAVLRGEPLAPSGEGMEIVRSLAHGHVLAALETARRIGLDRMLPQRGPQRRRNLALALIVGRLIEPAAKLATASALDDETASHSLGSLLGLGRVKVNELYAALDWLGRAQPHIESMLARRHLSDGCLVLYDLTSTFLEGRCCALGKFGYSRDGRRGKVQIVFGVLCARDGCPIAVEVFAGNVGDPSTVAEQVRKLKDRFRLRRVVLVGDRGMITSARIEADLRPAGIDWITALRAPAIQKLAADNGPLQMSLFHERNLAEIRSPDFPDERLIVCRNPALADERRRKRDELLAATEKELAALQDRIRREKNPLRGAADIGAAVGKALERHKVGKHFETDITDDDLVFTRTPETIATEAMLDGIYVIRTNVPAQTMAADQVVLGYKSLAHVERAFRSIKTVDLEVRPIFHYADWRVRGHVFLCMLSYYLEWHMRRALAPMLFEDHEREAAAASRSSPVDKAAVSPAAKRKAKSKTDDAGQTVASFQSVLRHLATLTRNTVRFGRDETTQLLSTPTDFQKRAFELLDIKPT